MGWDDEAEDWDDNPAVQTYSRAAFRSLLGLSGLSLEGKRVLDFGCGTGLLTAAMAAEAYRVVGLDRSVSMIAKLSAKKVANVTPIAGDLAEQDLGPFDLVTCSSVCGSLPDYPGTAKALAALLRPGGWFVQWDWELDPEAEEPYGLSRDAIRDALAGAGLVDVAVRVGFSESFEGMTMAPLMGIGRHP